MRARRPAAAAAAIKARRRGKRRSSRDRAESRASNRGGGDGGGTKEEVSPLDPPSDGEGIRSARPGGDASDDGGGGRSDPVPSKSGSEASAARALGAFPPEKSEASSPRAGNDRSKAPSSAKTSAETSKASKAPSASTKAKSRASASTAKTKNTFRLVPRKKAKFPPPKTRRAAFSPKRNGARSKPPLAPPPAPPLPEVGPTRMPESIVVRNKKRGVGVEIWNGDGADGASNLAGGTENRRALRVSDAGNRRHPPETNGKCRTKSARQKRKSRGDLPEAKRSRGRRDAPDTAITTVPCVEFHVPEYEPGRHGEDKYQEKKYLGLIEGVGGGDEEKDEGAVPHRGRLLELPGEVAPGAWKAQLLSDTVDGIESVRISLRRSGSPCDSLVDRLRRNGAVSVSVINPSKNRVKSFIDQGILTDDEIEDETEGREKVASGPFLGCVALVWFDGFTSASEAVNLANDVSGRILALCRVPPAEKRDDRLNLCKISREEGKNKDADDVGGILFRTKLDFSDEYSILVSHRGFEIDAVDVVFRKITLDSSIDSDALANVPQRGLTQSVMSHYLDCVGSSVDEIMNRFKESDAMTRRTSAPLTYDAFIGSKPTNDEQPSKSELSSVIEAPHKKSALSGSATAASKSVESTQSEQEIDDLLSDNHDDRQLFEDYGGTNDAFEPDAEDGHSDSSSSAASRLQVEFEKGAPDKPVKDNGLQDVGSVEISAKQSHSADVPEKYSPSPIFEGVKQRAYTIVHTPSDLLAKNTSAQNDEPEVNYTAKEGLGSEKAPGKIESPIRSFAKDASRVVCNGVRNQLERNKSCPRKICAEEPNHSESVHQSSPRALEVAKETNEAADRKGGAKTEVTSTKLEKHTATEDNELQDVSFYEIAAKQPHSGDLPAEYSPSPIFEGVKQRAYTSVHSPSDLLTKKCFAQNDELDVNGAAKEGLGSENTPVLSSNDASKVVYNEDENQLDADDSCPKKSEMGHQSSPRYSEVAKETDERVDRKGGAITDVSSIQLDKHITNAPEKIDMGIERNSLKNTQQTPSKIIQKDSNINSGIATNHRGSVGTENKSSARVVHEKQKVYSGPSKIKKDRTPVANASRDKAIKSSSSRVDRQQTLCVPPKRQNKHTPAPSSSFHNKQRRLHAQTTSRKPRSSRLPFSGSTNHAVKNLFKSPGLKKKEYVADLFDDELFGCPAKKTPAHRKSSIHLIEKNSCPRSTAKNGAVKSITGNAIGRRKPTVNLVPRSSSPVVTPGKEVAVQEDLHERYEEFHDAASFCPEDAAADTGAHTPTISHTPGKSPLIPEIGSRESNEQTSKVSEHSPPRYFHDDYYGHSPARIVESPSSITKLMKSPDSHGAFHDNYYGQQNCISSEDVFAPLYTGQPFHDSYFGQASHCGELSSTAILASPSSTQDVYDSYFGQQEIQPNSIKTRQLSGASLKPRSKHRNKMYCCVVLLVLSMLPGTMQPKTTRPAFARLEPVFAHLDYNILNTMDATHSDAMDSAAWDADNKVESKGWFSNWF